MRLFISYSRKDAEFAKKLTASLTALGLDAWIDMEDIPAGMKWSSAIQQGLDTSQVMILVITPDAMGSPNVEDEWQYFLDEKKLIIPVLLKPAKIHFQISRRQYINFDGADYAAAFSQLCTALRANGVEVAEVATLPEPKPPVIITPSPTFKVIDARKLTWPYDPQVITTPPTLKRPTSLDLMPPPFAWISIPEGKVMLQWGGYVPEGGQTFDVPAFTIAKYPVTNAQFAKFIEAGGYTEQKWWTAQGWRLKESAKRTEPYYWRNDKWNPPDCPVVGVSWYEAVAFCLWLRNATGEEIMLPTEQQWQRAAQGNTERAYSWGNKFDKAKCNTSESGIKQTTPVDRYPSGASPYGVMDMIGNVWEWCLTNHESGAQDVDKQINSRIMRGGAFSISQEYARATYRDREYLARKAYNESGFRVVANRLSIEQVPSSLREKG